MISKGIRPIQYLIGDSCQRRMVLYWKNIRYPATARGQERLSFLRNGRLKTMTTQPITWGVGCQSYSTSPRFLLMTHIPSEGKFSFPLVGQRLMNISANYLQLLELVRTAAGGLFKQDFLSNCMPYEMLAKIISCSERSGHGERRGKPFKNCRLGIANCKLKDPELWEDGLELTVE